MHSPFPSVDLLVCFETPDSGLFVIGWHHGPQCSGTGSTAIVETHLRQHHNHHRMALPPQITRRLMRRELGHASSGDGRHVWVFAMLLIVQKLILHHLLQHVLRWRRAIRPGVPGVGTFPVRRTHSTLGMA